MAAVRRSGGGRDIWVAAFFAVVLAAPVLRLASPERQTLGHELVTVTGLLAVALLVCTVVLPARLRAVTRAFGIESVLASHRTLGLATIVVVLAHVAAVVAGDPAQVSLLVPFLNPLQSPDPMASHALLEPLLTPPARSMTGSAATGALVASGLLAARRGVRYEVWRGWHLTFAAVALVATAAHVVLINHLIPTTAIMGVLAGDPIGWPLLWAHVVDVPSLVYLAGLAAVVVAVSTRRWLVMPLGPRSGYTVVAVRANSPSVSTIAVRPRGRRGRRFEPGQFAWLRTHRGPLRQDHPFTVSSATQDRPTIEFTIRHHGDFSSELRGLEAGERVWLDGPHGSFVLPTAGRAGVVMICQGVGVTPILSMLRSLAGSRSGRRRGLALRLIFTDRPNTTLFRHELAVLSPDLNLKVYEMSGRPLTVDRLEQLLPPGMMLRNQMNYYVCGPGPMVADVGDVLARLHVPADRVKTERFDS